VAEKLIMPKNLKIFCWNVNGIRAIQKKGFPEWIKKTSPDILCLQETKAQHDQLDETLTKMDGYHSHYFSAEKKGYSGVATYSKIPPQNVKTGFNNPLFDTEGRVIETDFNEFTLFNAYFPNGGKGPERVKYKLDFYDSLFFHIDKIRKKQKNIIICGDFNTAHQEIDLARPQQNVNKSGFMAVEREWIDKIINLGYIDIFREYNKEAGQYTYWDQITFARDKNIGWRIDYFFISKEMRNMVIDSKIHSDVLGSDHCPIELDLKL
jgi:exodeoxyribonuclease-3